MDLDDVNRRRNVDAEISRAHAGGACEMTVFQHPARLLLVASAFTIAVAGAPVAVFFAVPVGPSSLPVSCPAGETEDMYTG